MTDSVELSVRQFIAAWNLLCAPCPGHRAASVDGTEFIFSGIPLGFFNVAVPTRRGITARELAATARRASTFASDPAVPWFFVVTHEALEPGLDAAAELDGCGLAPAMTLTGMVAPRVPASGRLPEGLRLELARSDSACSAVLDVNAAAYGMDLAAAKGVMGHASFWKEFFPVVGSAAGKPACCASVAMVDGHRYVGWVATDPGQQRRGYAAAAMLRALEAAAEVHGEVPSFLHATDAGKPIYARMGYEPIATHALYMEKRFLDAH